MDSSSNVPDSSNKHSTSGNVHFDTSATSHELNPSSQGAKVQQNVEIDKNNREEIKTEQYMNKKLIRLTESDLHRIVRESVNNVLTELDWKTYASAADKRREQGSKDKAEELDNAASKALSKKYGRKLNTYGVKPGYRSVEDADMEWTGPSLAKGPSPIDYWYYSTKDRDWRNQDEYKDYDESKYGKVPFATSYDREKYNFMDDDEYEKMVQNKAIGQELDHFTHGRYSYDKEKGWNVKNESKIGRIVSEVVNNMLKNRH